MEERSEFKSQLNYSDRKMWIPETIKHPAKAHLGMIEAIILEYTKEGDTVLDPMAGIGSTLILGMLHNRNVIGIEYEDKFCKIIKQNIELNKKRNRLFPLGHTEIIQGDARFLPIFFNAVGDIDSVVFSPPFSGIRLDVSNRREIQKQAIESFEIHGYFEFMGKRWLLEEWKQVNNGRMDGRGVRHGNVKTYGDSPDNIGNMKHGDIDAIVTSPPYVESAHDPALSEETIRKTEESQGRKYSRKSFTGAHEYSKDKANIGNLKYVDSIITSPPYEEGIGHKAGKNANPDEHPERLEMQRRYTESFQGDNIGNLKGQTYLEAMKMVYQGCYDILKENGTMVLITKNFIRNKKIISLDGHTIKLCESVGFKFVKRLYRKITHQSFWRNLYKKKYGIEIPFEDILVFSKFNAE